MSAETRVKETFERLAREVSVRPDAWPRLQRRVSSYHRHHLVTVAVIVALVAGGGAAGLTRLSISRPPTITHPAPQDKEWATYTDAAYGWSMRYPPGWRLQPVDIRSRIYVAGALVTNIDHTFRHPEILPGATTAWDFRGLSDTLVVVQFQHIVGGPAALKSEKPDTRFPLSLDHATTYAGPARETYGAPPQLFLPVTLNGDDAFAVLAWFGSAASEGDKEIARRIVASIQFGTSETLAGEGCGPPICPRRISSEDREHAKQVALADDGVARRLDRKRFGVVYFAAYGPFTEADKADPNDPCLRVECIQVLIYVYSDDTSISAFVEQNTWKVVRIRDEQGQPGLSEEEQQLAHRLAEEDPEVQKLIAGDPHTHPWLAQSASQDTGPCATQRCAIAVFFFGDFGRTGQGRELFVMVNLSSDTVVERTAQRCDKNGCRDGW